WWCLSQNINAAKASGLPYVVLPWNTLNIIWLTARPLLLPYLRKLPFKDRLWFTLLAVDWPWHEQYTPFERLGSDSFMTVSAAKNYLHTADPAVIEQIVRRRDGFPKPIEVYRSLDLYGKNVVSTEGDAWKHHRKTVSPPFNEKNNRMVWYESIRQGQSMVKGWMGGQIDSSPALSTVAADCMRLSLYVISCAGFGVNLNWPRSEREDELKLANGHVNGHANSHLSSKSFEAPKDREEPEFGPDHKLSYTDALSGLLKNMVWILILPIGLLKHLPFKGPNISYDAYVEWGKYLRELFEKKRNDLAEGKSQEGMDLLGFLMKGSLAATASAGKAPAKSALTDTEIMGNAFVFLLAGHETAANSIHFSCLYLALHPSSQRRLQLSLDKIFGSRPISDWDYEKDFNALFSTMAGAVLAEELRLIPPVPAIPKCTLPTSPPQPLKIDGKTYNIPPDTYINLLSVAVHRNPKYWPSSPPSDPADPVHPSSNLDNDLEEFKPERWLLHEIDDSNENPSSDASTTEHTEDAPNTATGTSSSAALHRPPRGAYIPFSEGYRACLGRRFAQTEVLAVLAVIFKDYSMELDVGDHGSDEEIATLGEEEKKGVWDKVVRDARELMREKMGMIFSLQLRGALVKLRVVRRGKERFAY
ncbi:MAG: hypothetical protein Q9183_004326, partial [Haloplaca sp. 2 TL-2023]